MPAQLAMYDSESKFVTSISMTLAALPVDALGSMHEYQGKNLELSTLVASSMKSPSVECGRSHRILAPVPL